MTKQNKRKGWLRWNTTTLFFSFKYLGVWGKAKRIDFGEDDDDDDGDGQRDLDLKICKLPKFEGVKLREGRLQELRRGREKWME